MLHIPQPHCMSILTLKVDLVLEHFPAAGHRNHCSQNKATTNHLIPFLPTVLLGPFHFMPLRSLT